MLDGQTISVVQWIFQHWIPEYTWDPSDFKEYRKHFFESDMDRSCLESFQNNPQIFLGNSETKSKGDSPSPLFTSNKGIILRYFSDKSSIFHCHENQNILKPVLNSYVPKAIPASIALTFPFHSQFSDKKVRYKLGGKIF